MSATGTRGDVWYVRPDLPSFGSEIIKDRPCLIVQPAEMDALRTVIVAPITSRGFAAPYRVPTTFGAGGFILLDHIRAVDRSRLRRHAGEIDASELVRVLKTLQAIFSA